MNVSVLLRLLREPLAAGRLVGHVQIVETDERTIVRDTDELVSYLSERTRAAPRPVPQDAAEDNERG